MQNISSTNVHNKMRGSKPISPNGTYYHYLNTGVPGSSTSTILNNNAKTLPLARNGQNIVSINNSNNVHSNWPQFYYEQLQVQQYSQPYSFLLQQQQLQQLQQQQQQQHQNQLYLQYRQEQLTREHNQQQRYDNSVQQGSRVVFDNQIDQLTSDVYDENPLLVCDSTLNSSAIAVDDDSEGENIFNSLNSKDPTELYRLRQKAGSSCNKKKKLSKQEKKRRQIQYKQEQYERETRVLEIQREREEVLSNMISELCFWEFPSAAIAKAASYLGNKNQGDFTNYFHDGDREQLDCYNKSREEKTTITTNISSKQNMTDGITTEVNTHQKNNQLDSHLTSTIGPASNSSYRHNDSYSSVLKKDSIELEDDGDDGQGKSNTIPSTTWRQATDPATGRLYYYDSITRKTQWDKPKELRMLEKMKKKQQRRADQEFFRIMEENIRRSLLRGELIPNVPRDHINKEGPPREPSPPSSNENQKTNLITRKQHQSNDAQNRKQLNEPSQRGDSLIAAAPPSIRVRTISGMDQHVLAQLSGGGGLVVVSGSSSSSSISHERLSNTNSSSVEISSEGTASNSNVSRGFTSSVNNLTTTTNHISHRIPNISSGPDINSTGTPIVAIDGRPPLAKRRSLSGINNSVSSSTLPPLASNTSSSSLGTTAVGTSTVAPTSNTPGVSASLGRVVPTSKSLTLDVGAASKAPISKDAELRGVSLLAQDTGGVNNSSMEICAVDTTGTSPSTLSNCNSTHIRRNTGGTMYFDTTMDNPDIDATMHCVCGVYRAHIVHYVEQHKDDDRQLSHNNHPLLPSADVFDDDYEHKHTAMMMMQRGELTCQPLRHSRGIVVPSLGEIKAFYREFYERSQMEHDTIIMSLIYVERLMKSTDGVVSPNQYNWRSVLFSCMILASKVWDDLSMWNIDFSNVSQAAAASAASVSSLATSSSTSNSNSSSANTAMTEAEEHRRHNLLSSFSLKRINQLELAVLTNLNFRTAIPASEYAKYYFLIRTMLLRSGLLNKMSTDSKNHNVSDGNSSSSLVQDSSLTTTSLTNVREAANRRIEDRTSRYQELLSNEYRIQAATTPNAAVSTSSGNHSSNRRLTVRSVDWSCLPNSNITQTQSTSSKMTLLSGNTTINNINVGCGNASTSKSGTGVVPSSTITDSPQLSAAVLSS